jgi:lycopene beta-cyclase
MGGAIVSSGKGSGKSSNKSTNHQAGENSNESCDLVIVGGGLAGSLTALTFATLKPDLQIRLIESGNILSGHQTWVFRESDVGAAAMDILRPLLSNSWSEYSVEFPKMKRSFSQNFHCIRSQDFHREVTAKLGSRILLDSKVNKMSDGFVVLESGKVIEGRCILDARGIDVAPEAGLSAFLKSIGIEFKLKSPHGLKSPVAVDANCPQLDGFRYFEVMPLDEKRLIVFENYYSDNPKLNRERIVRSLESYVQRKGWEKDSVLREETSVLPVPMVANLSASLTAGEPLQIGTRGGYFHSTTTDSLPDTLRIAEILSGVSDLSTASARETLMKFRRPILSRQRFYRILNRLMFFASEPTLRFNFFQNIYEMPQELIERFYAGRSSWSDRLRILRRRPAMPFSRTFSNLRERNLRDRLSSRHDTAPSSN